MTFAKKASAFNSWFENAEEDLTDPVRCNSLEEIKALREAHEAFRSSLSSAQADFNQLAELDQQIKSYQVVSNPYTWFTMEALEETWRNLQKIIKVLRDRICTPYIHKCTSVGYSNDISPRAYRFLPENFILFCLLEIFYNIQTICLIFLFNPAQSAIS